VVRECSGERRITRPGNSENDDLARSSVPIAKNLAGRERARGRGGGQVIYNAAELLARDNARGRITQKLE